MRGRVASCVVRAMQGGVASLVVLLERCMVASCVVRAMRGLASCRIPCMSGSNEDWGILDCWASFQTPETSEEIG